MKGIYWLRSDLRLHDNPALLSLCEECESGAFDFFYLSLKKERQEKTICPSEVLPLEKRSDKKLMEEIRKAARRLTHAGLISLEQKGKVVDPTNFKGPIRLRGKS